MVPPPSAKWVERSKARVRDPDHRGPAKNKRPLKIREQLQNKRHDVAYFLVYQWIGEACSSISLFLK